MKPGYERPLDWKHGRVDMNHGAGGRASAQLVRELFVRAFDHPALAAGDDGACLPAPPPGHRLVISREMASFTRSVTGPADGASRLEVSNGAGVSRLARRTADRLEREGVVSARLTNASHFRYAQTRIEYLPGQDAAVQAVADRLPVQVKLVPVARLDRNMSLKLVLGQDAAGKSIAAWLDAGEAPQMVQTDAASRPVS